MTLSELAIETLANLGNAAIIATEQAHTSGVYPKRDVALVRGLGAQVWDADGVEYLDCTSAQGAANLGHCHPAVVAALHEQAQILISCPEIFPNDQRAAYQQALVAALPRGMARVFLCNSGAEAIEGALKFARLLTGRTGIVATKRGFHGRTMGALSTTWEPKYREPFAPLLADVTHVAYNNLDELDRAVHATTAAVLIELVQGEGGVRPADPAYVQGVAALCRERGALLIVDEVQTGFGRTGRLWACDHYGITPDLITLAKSIAGGVPMGAIGIHARFGTLQPAMHGTTFGGNPLGCAVARAVLHELTTTDLLCQATLKGEYLLGKLRALTSPKIREVRGMGLIVGLELKERVQPYLIRLLEEQRVLALPAGPTVLRLLPPLVIEYAQLDRAVAAVTEVLA